MDGLVLGQLGMEGGCEQTPLLDQHRQAAGAAEYPNALAHAADDGGANEHHFHRPVRQFRAFAPAHRAIDLAAVSVALHGDVHQPQPVLRRVHDVLRQQNGSGAGSEDRLARSGEVPDGSVHAFVGENVEHGRALTAGQDEPRNLLEIAHVLNQLPGCSDSVEHLGMELKVALDCQDTDTFVRRSLSVVR